MDTLKASEMKDASGNILSLGTSELFMNHLSDKKNFAHVILEQINSGIYEEYKKFMNNESVILDLGGNIGLFSIYFSPIVKKVISVEPTPKHLDVYKELLNNLNIKNIELVEGAVSSTQEKIRFLLHSHNTTMNSIVRHKNYNSSMIEVDGYTISNIIKDHEKIDFCKIDIEGYENVLIHDKTFEQCAEKIKNVFVEVHDFDGLSYNHHCKKILESLNNYGYVAEQISFDTIKGTRK